MRKPTLLAVLVFLSLVAEDETTVAFYNDMWTPARLFEWLNRTLPIKLNMFQIGCLILLFLGKKVAVARPISLAIRVSLASLCFAAFYGLVQGGLVKPIFTQVVAWLSCLLFVATANRVLTTADDFRLLQNGIVAAGIWRAGLAILYYMQVRDRDWSTMPGYMTSHEDTVVFVVAATIMISRFIEFRNKKTLRNALLVLPLLILAIQVNNRRVAWASLGGGMIVLYAMLPAKARIAREVNRWLLRAAPLVILYVAVGWGRPEKIFKPLQAISSMGAGEVNNSTRARINENWSLLVMIQERPLLGTGLGHEWEELDATFTVPLSTFPLYHYCPHNNVLALLAFCGGIGFAALWMVIPISVYLNARTYRHARDPTARSVAVVGIVQAVAYLNQAYGDMGAMGVPHIGVGVILGAGIAASARLSVLSGAWPSVASRQLGTA